MTCPEIGHPIADIRTGSHQPFRAQRVERERSKTNHAPLHSCCGSALKLPSGFRSRSFPEFSKFHF